MEPILIGVTDRTITVFIPDPASTTGAGKTGLVAANLTCSYTRVETDNDVAVVDVTGSLNDLAALTSAHNDWGIIEVSPTVAPGLYRLDLADAVFASGAWYAVVQVTITSGLAACTPKAFQLVAYNPLDGVRLGLTALPNAAADAAGGLPISDAGGLDLDARLDAAVSSRMATYVQPTGFLAATFPAGTVANTTNITAGTITTATNVTTVNGLAANVVTAAALAADAVAEIADGVWDEPIAGHLGAGSTGAALNAAGSAGDPWATPLPGAYGAGTAGKIVGDNLNAAVGSVPTAVQNADALLGRNVAGGSSSGRLVKEALYAMRNRVDVSSGVTMDVYQTDDTTLSWQLAITTDAAALPIKEVG